ncbi:metal ABC transporter ATP-binding protein [Rhodovulum marinum]|uniref:Zinc transport system ATP-binding protein n=1 Tax=Rhodovulum marinum TaxID=320662 RepID=A0A4R2Q6F8_9RHOB|nr:metal ABC transporter ATP-binding protein [Rhodovulum marinum]TCP44280.1 zinc transport system ATP-binding protein [Rhodovulum marinum]
MTLIAAQGLGVSYGAMAALRDVDLVIEPGEIVTVVGPNGSGKSTLVRALLGVVRPSAGQVTRRAGLRIGYVPQRLAVDDRMPLSVRRFLSLPDRRDRDEMRAMLDKVGVPGLEDRQMTALSGGQFQRVLLARALLADPELLILDEATQGLDQPGTAAFYQLIEDVRRETGVAILMVSHDLHVVMSASDRVICLNGHVCCQGQPHVVTAAPEYRALFGLGTHGTMALYQHKHDHAHDACDHDHDHDHTPAHGTATQKDPAHAG